MVAERIPDNRASFVNLEVSIGSSWNSPDRLAIDLNGADLTCHKGSLA